MASGVGGLVICSINETGAILRKAAVGSGFPIGLADVISAAGVWLCVRDLDGIGAVLEVLDAGYPTSVAARRNGALITVSHARTGRSGVSLIELLIAGEVERVIIENSDSIMLLAGMAGVAATNSGVAFAFTIDGESIIIDSRRIEASGLSGSSRVEIEITEPRLQPFQPLRSALVVDEEQWESISGLAARIYVPATEESRLSGAGAGLTDND
ncbi:MAG: DUF3726 domain-containing protein [Acidimicrobiales bacterium]|nr:DUF3726 domain-containing protein [Acidimicrobiales bacterium]MDG2216714.1 DUF3726 domain-containing protein [Acidimicrobiales bacterium]